MKILFVARRYPPDAQGSLGTVLATLVREARGRHEVHLVAGWTTARDRIPADALGIDLRLPRPAARFWFARGAAGAMRRFDPDVVVTDAIEIPRRRPTALLVHAVEPAPGVTGFAKRWKAARFDAIVVPAEATRRAYLRHGGMGNLEVLPDPVDLDRFRVEPRGPGDLVRLAYPGRILPGKAQHLAIDAVARLDPGEKTRVHLTIVGKVVDRVYFDQLAVQARGQPVTLLGEVPDIAPFYRNADLVLFPSLLREGFGATAIEAMACGRPVVWTDQDAIRESTGGIGFPVHPDDARALRDVIRRFLADETPFRRAGVEGRRLVEARYAPSLVWTHWERLLSSLA